MIGGLLLAGGGGWLIRPWDSVPVPLPQPAANYEEAAAEALRHQAEARDCLVQCQTQLITHGRRTTRAVVLFHGFTNCPAQFRRLGEQLHARGWNVLIPRAPHHGKKDRLTNEEIGELTAAELITFANESVDLARGLGDQVTVAGLSMGGLMSSWLAQFRPDIERAVILSPALSFWPVPEPAEPALIRFVGRIPNLMLPWDPARPTAGPPHAYPRFSTHGLAAMLQISEHLQATAQRHRPVARSVRVLTNPNDRSVRNRITDMLTDSWKRQQVRDLETYEFPAAAQLRHDLIDPTAPGQPIDQVYPVVISAIDEPHIRPLSASVPR